MRKYTLLFGLVIFITIALPTIFFISNFRSQEISNDIGDWSSFGAYMAGTIGTLFSIVVIIVLYLTYINQKKQQFENTFNQFLTSYSTLLNLIHERWLLFPKTQYLNGREIFGCAANYLTYQDEEFEGGDQFPRLAEIKFKKMHNKHINVFGHYMNFIVEITNQIKNEPNLNKRLRQQYLRRFSSLMSFYELIYVGYYMLYYIKGNQNELYNTILENFLYRINKETATQLPHKIVVEYLKSQLFEN